MSLKLKALGLSLVAAMAVSAVAVMNASATEGGHFVTTGNTHTIIQAHVAKEEAGTPHTLHLTLHGLNGRIGCNKQTYEVTTTEETSPTIIVKPKYEECSTTGGPGVTVHMNECEYKFDVALNTTDNTEQTAHLLCNGPTKHVQITHDNCTVTIHPQTVNGGITYTTKVNATTGKHEITADINVQFNTTREGLCQFIVPTNGPGTLVGSATVTAKNTAGEQVDLTAT